MQVDKGLALDSFSWWTSSTTEYVELTGVTTPSSLALSSTEAKHQSRLP